MENKELLEAQISSLKKMVSNLQQEINLINSQLDEISKSFEKKTLPQSVMASHQGTALTYYERIRDIIYEFILGDKDNISLKICDVLSDLSKNAYGKTKDVYEYYQAMNARKIINLLEDNYFTYDYDDEYEHQIHFFVGNIYTTYYCMEKKGSDKENAWFHLIDAANSKNKVACFNLHFLSDDVKDKVYWLQLAEAYGYPAATFMLNKYYRNN